MNKLRQAAAVFSLSAALTGGNVLMSQGDASAAQSAKQKEKAIDSMAHNPARINALGNTAASQLQSELSARPVKLGYVLGMCAVIQMSTTTTQVNHNKKHTTVEAAVVPNPGVVHITASTGVTVSEAVGLVNNRIVRGAVTLSDPPEVRKKAFIVPEINLNAGIEPEGTQASVEFEASKNSIVLVASGQRVMDGVAVSGRSLLDISQSNVAQNICQSTILPLSQATPSTSAV